MIDAEKLLDRLLGELPKPDGSPQSLTAYLDAVERIVQIVKSAESKGGGMSYPPGVRNPMTPPDPCPHRQPRGPLRNPWEEQLERMRRQGELPRATFSTGPLPAAVHEDDGA